MNSKAINQFVQDVCNFGPVRVKALQHGKEARLTNATVEAKSSSLIICSDADCVHIPFSEIENISFSPEKRKYFVRLRDGLVELRPDDED
ncbi:MAG: hypothetical protein GX162_13725 [Firmicutes bacterium]|nr:hypothetical protein [Bacillota bacterium]